MGKRAWMPKFPQLCPVVLIIFRSVGSKATEPRTSEYSS